jgi:hypothetical protein
VVPLLLVPLLELGAGAQQQQQQQQQQRRHPGQGEGGSGGVRPSCALYILERIVVSCSYKPLLHQLLLALLGVQQQQQQQRGAGAAGGSGAGGPRIPPPPEYDVGAAPPLAAGPPPAAAALQQRAHAYGVPCRYVLLGLLRGEQPAPAIAVLRLLAAIQQSRAAAPELLYLLGLASKARAQEVEARCAAGRCPACALQQELQLFVVASSSSSFMQALPDPLARDAMLWVHSFLGLPGGERTTPAGHEASAQDGGQQQQGQQQGQGQPTAEPEQQGQGHGNGDSSSADAGAGAADEHGSGSGCSTPAAAAAAAAAADEAAVQRLQLEEPGSPALPPSPGRPCEQHGYAGGLDQEVVDALFQLLSLHMFPAAGLWLLGWQLHQLLPLAAAAPCAESPAAAAAAAYSSQPLQLLGSEASGSPNAAASAAEAEQAADWVSPRSGAASPEGRGGPGGEAASAGMPSSVPAVALHTARITTLLPAAVAPAPASVGSAAAASQPILPPSSQLTAHQQQRLQTALSAAQTALLEELSGMWCEAVFPIISNEWPAAREGTLRPVLRASSDTLLGGPALYPLCMPCPLGAAAAQAEPPLSSSARAALRVLYAVQRAVALLQLKEVRCWLAAGRGLAPLQPCCGSLRTGAVAAWGHA